MGYYTQNCIEGLREAAESTHFWGEHYTLITEQTVDKTEEIIDMLMEYDEELDEYFYVEPQKDDKVLVIIDFSTVDEDRWVEFYVDSEGFHKVQVCGVDQQSINKRGKYEPGLAGYVEYIYFLIRRARDD
jgi:hypothetical protein